MISANIASSAVMDHVVVMGVIQNEIVTCDHCMMVVVAVAVTEIVVLVIQIVICDCLPILHEFVIPRCVFCPQNLSRKWLIDQQFPAKEYYTSLVVLVIVYTLRYDAHIEDILCKQCGAGNVRMHAVWCEN